MKKKRMGFEEVRQFSEDGLGSPGGEWEVPEEVKEKVLGEFFKKWHSKGGRARMASMTKEQRMAFSRAGVDAREKKNG